MPAEIAATTFELRPDGGGPPLRGDLRTALGHRPETAVVIVHGFKGFRRFGAWPSLARALAARGHAAVTVDLSHNGIEPDGEDFTRLDLFAAQTHTRNVDEIRLVVDALASGALGGRAMRRVGVLGHSRGGGEAVLAAAETPRIDALVTWAAIASVHRWTPEQVARWRRGEDVVVMNGRTGQEMPVGPAYFRDVEAHTERLDIRRAARMLDVPWLLVHWDADETVPVQDAHDLHAMAGPRAELLVLPGGDHGLGAKHPYAGATPLLREAAAATLAFLDAHLAPVRTNDRPEPS